MILEKWMLYAIGGFLGLVTFIIFLVNLIKAIKEKNTTKVKNLLLTAAQEAVSYAESILGISGETKKSIALTKMNQIFIDKKIKYNEEAADTAIENAINFSKEVNAKEREKQQDGEIEFIEKFNVVEAQLDNSVKVEESQTKKDIVRLKALLNK